MDEKANLSKRQRDILKLARYQLCELHDSTDRLHPLSPEWKKVTDLIEGIEELLGY